MGAGGIDRLLQTYAILEQQTAQRAQQAQAQQALQLQGAALMQRLRETMAYTPTRDFVDRFSESFGLDPQMAYELMAMVQPTVPTLQAAAAQPGIGEVPSGEAAAALLTGQTEGGIASSQTMAGLLQNTDLGMAPEEQESFEQTLARHLRSRIATGGGPAQALIENQAFAQTPEQLSDVLAIQQGTALSAPQQAQVTLAEQGLEIDTARLAEQRAQNLDQYNLAMAQLNQQWQLAQMSGETDVTASIETMRKILDAATAGPLPKVANDQYVTLYNSQVQLLNSKLPPDQQWPLLPAGADISNMKLFEFLRRKMAGSGR